MELKKKVLTIKQPAQRVINKVRINANSIKKILDDSGLSPVDKSVFAGRFESEEFRSFICSKRGVEIGTECFIDKRTIQGHKKEGLKDSSGSKTIDFYMFYFEEYVEAMKAAIANLNKTDKSIDDKGKPTTDTSKSTVEVLDGQSKDFSSDTSNDDLPTERRKPSRKQIINVSIIMVLVSVLIFFALKEYYWLEKNEGVIPCFDTEIVSSSPDRINIVAFKESPTKDNSGYAKKLYDRLTKINLRDSLGYDIQYCEGYNTYKNFYGARLDSIDTESYKRTGRTIAVEYYSNGVPSKNKNSKVFDLNKDQLAGLHTSVWVSNKYNEDDLDILAYCLLIKSMGTYKNRTKRIQKAIDYINNYLIKYQDLSKNSDLLLHRSFLKGRMGDKQGALNDTKKALEHQPNNDSALRGLSNYYKERLDKEGLQYFERRIKLSPKSCNLKAEYYLFKARVNNDFQTLLQELNDLEDCTRLQKRFLKEVQGIALLNLGQTQKGLLCFEALSIDGGTTDKLNYAYANYVSEKYEEALTILIELKKEIPESSYGGYKPNINAILGSTYFKIGNHSKAIECFKSIGSNLAVGYIYFLEKDYQNALGHTRSHILRNSEDPDGYNQRRVIANALKKPKLAVKDSIYILNNIDQNYYKNSKHLGGMKQIGVDKILADYGYKFIQHPPKLTNRNKVK